MPDDDVDFEIVTTASQLGPPPALRRERVVLVDWKTVSGRAAAFYVYEMSALQYGEYQECLRIYKDGELSSIDLRNDELKFLAFTIRDPNGNRLWPTTSAAVAQLGSYGKADINLLLAASNRMNANTRKAVERAEGNSEGARNGSSPSTSLSLSDSPAPTGS